MNKGSLTTALALARLAAAAGFAAGMVTGLVKDALQRPLAGAAVRLGIGEGRVVARETTGKDGTFVLLHVAPGTYALIGEKRGFATATAILAVGPAGAAADLTLASKGPLELAVTAHKLSEARAQIEPRTGATTYNLSKQAIAGQPGSAWSPCIL